MRAHSPFFAKIVLSVGLCGFAVLPNTVSAMTWAELSQEIEAVEGGAEGDRQIILRFSEMVHMMVSYTRSLHEQGLTPLICPPRGQAMNIDDLVSIVRRQAMQSSAGDETLVQDLLLAGFRDEFAC